MKPTIENKTGAMEGEELSHPAFGMLSMTRISGNGESSNMYGSNLKHDGVIRLEVSQSTMTRSLSRNWYNTGKTIVQLEMTTTQLAELLFNQNTSGVPVTLEKYTTDNMIRVPKIESLEPMSETFKRELDTTSKKATEGVDSCSSDLDAMLNGKGSISKTALREIADRLRQASGNLEKNLSFVVDSHKEDMLETVNSAKLEISNFMAMQGLSKSSENSNLPRISVDTEHESQGTINYTCESCANTADVGIEIHKNEQSYYECSCGEQMLPTNLKDLETLNTVN